MPVRIIKTLRAPLSGLTAALGLGLALPSHGQAPPPTAPAQFDPSDVYFQGYLSTRKAEQLEADGNFIGALEKLRKADQLFGAVRTYYPEWKPEMVSGRCEKNTEAIGKVQAKAEEQLKANRNTVAELEGGEKKSGTLIDPSKDFIPPAREILKVDPLVSRRLADAEAEVKRLRDLTAKAKPNTPSPANDQERMRDQSRLNDFARQRDSLQADLRNAENDVKALRSRLAQAPDASEIKTLNQRIATLQQDRESASRRLANAETEIKKLRDLAANAKAATPTPTTPDDQERLRDKSRLHDVTRQRDSLNAELKAAENNLQILRSSLAAAPMESELTTLNQRIRTLEQEREAMAMALRQSQGAHNDAMTNIASLQTDLTNLQTELKSERQKYTDLNRDLNAERGVANSVVAGQRRQLDVLEKHLQTKNAQLADANNRISSLMNELQQSHDAFAQIRDERDGLLQERDQMAALLKLNEGGRIQQLIEQNMALAKTLREANEKFERINRESNADKEAIADAARDLAIAKSQINRLHQDKRAQDKHLADLETRLKTEEQALAKGQVSSDPAEVEVLRDIIKRQLRIQERRRQARDLLVEAARDLGSQDERIAKAIAMFDAQEIALTPEEQKLIADKQVDGEFISPFARDRASVGEATAELNRDITIFERTAEKSFIAGRLLPTRELYEMILEQNPGHTPSLCKLGIVHLKLNESEAASDAFRRALELDSNNAYAFRMFGFSLMKLGDITAAEQAARRSVELAPNDAKNHMLLATLCYRLGRSGEAESHFKGAITSDPLPSEPYFNLALICSRDGRIKDAKNYYHQALDRGALPDPELEDILAKK